MVSLPFTISPGYTKHVKEGDSVKVGQLLAENASPQEQRISLSDAFLADAHIVGKYVKVEPGDHIKNGDTLAIKKSLISEVKVLSEVDGTVVAFERDTGELVIRIESKNEGKVTSPIDGIVSVCNNDQIVIETDKDVLLGEYGSGGKTEAEAYSVSPLSDDNSSLLYALDTKIIGKVILAEETDRDVILKAIGMGVEGIISASASETDISYLLSRNISTPVVIVSKENFRKVARWNSKKIFLDGMGKTILLLHI